MQEIAIFSLALYGKKRIFSCVVAEDHVKKGGAMKQKIKKTVIGVALSPDLDKRLKEEAKRRECPKSVVVRMALQQLLAAK